MPTAAQTIVTPEPTLTPTPTPEPNLLLIAQPDSLTLVVTAETVNLTGFGFAVLIDDEVVVIELADRVDALVLLRNTAPAGACFQFVVSGESPVLPSACTNQGYLYRVQVSAADQFWYDRLRNQLRDVGIISAGELTGELCSGALLEVGCEVEWESPSNTNVASMNTETVTPSWTQTPTVDTSCQARVIADFPINTVQMLNVPNGTNARLVSVDTEIVILESRSIQQTIWYKVQVNQSSQVGWLREENVNQTTPCPHIIE
jgi:hypothetical protein